MDVTIVPVLFSTLWWSVHEVECAPHLNRQGRMALQDISQIEQAARLERPEMVRFGMALLSCLSRGMISP